MNDSRRDLLHHISDEVVLVAETVGVLLPWQQNTASNIALCLKHSFERSYWVKQGPDVSPVSEGGRSKSSCKLSVGVFKTEEMTEILRRYTECLPSTQSLPSPYITPLRHSCNICHSHSFPCFLALSPPLVTLLSTPDRVLPQWLMEPNNTRLRPINLKKNEKNMEN